MDLGWGGGFLSGLTITIFNKCHKNAVFMNNN